MLLQPPVWKTQANKAEERTVWKSKMHRGDHFEEQLFSVGHIQEEFQFLVANGVY